MVSQAFIPPVPPRDVGVFSRKTDKNPIRPFFFRFGPNKHPTTGVKLKYKETLAQNDLENMLDTYFDKPEGSNGAAKLRDDFSLEAIFSFGKVYNPNRKQRKPKSGSIN